ncbi:FRG domain-containing protein [Bizionia myxarmorum]|uniref:FRG domain-containing protein n=1 Tax=Bizionia myxarmorum TaxID=291186 RepID=A0A5D0R0I6_9FLAO|nr:FRG domain-containing protein [Bizionia myxarmorum]TYB74371.1 FRG domain-containing protein [Bizionia myxarmorum]
MVKNITNFINEIKRLGIVDQYENYYRGHSDINFELKPSIYRDGLIYNEDNIFKESISRVPLEFINAKSTVEKLVKMQHYGIPTRLLDITANPLVALYFACNKDFSKDGEVVYLRIPKNHIKYYDSDVVSVLSNIAKRPENFEIDTSTSKISEFNQTTPIEYLLHEIKEEKPYFQNLINPKHMEQVFAVKVKLDNERILKQEGAFLIFGIDANKIRPARVPTDWILNRTTKVKLEIAANRKRAILKELATFGISNRTLFPELENQGIFLIDKYKRKTS